jgi:multidrug efflux pump subunit AcrB
MIQFCFRKAWLAPSLAALITIAAFISLILVGTDISSPEAEGSISARVEFEGGFRKEEGDIRLASWAASLIEHEGILAVQTSARPGSGQVLVNFDPRKIKSTQVRTLLRSKKIPGGFIYIPEPSRDDRIWEIKVYGDDDSLCRELAEKAARLCTVLPLVREVILNFKDGNPKFSILPQRERLAEAGISFYTAADILRRGIYGPVIYKRIEEGAEIDVRLRLSQFETDKPSLPEDFMRLPVVMYNDNGTSIIRFDSLGSSRRDSEPSVIRREDRRRVASFSVRTPVIDPRRVQEQTMAVLKQIELPPGYGIEFDPEAIQRAQALSGTGFRFLLALLFCYMVMAAANESFRFPFLVLSAVPPSLAVPVLIMVLAGTPMNAAMACSLVAVSGMTITASIIVAGEFRREKPILRNRGVGFFYSCLRRCLPVLFSTGGTTITGALPFLFLSEGGNNMLKSLSLVTNFGVTASLICSLIIIPSLIMCFERHRLG